MDKEFFASRRVIFTQFIFEKQFESALQVLKELIEADLEVNFRVESKKEVEENEKRHSILGEALRQLSEYEDFVYD